MQSNESDFRGDWLRKQLVNLGELEGSDPIFWLNDNKLVIITLEEDDEPDEYYVSTGIIGGKLQQQRKVIIRNNSVYSEKKLKEKGYRKLTNPELEKIYDDVMLA